MPSDNDSPKEHVARLGASLVQDGMTVGLGSGSTATMMVEHLAARVKHEGLTITGIASSRSTAELARRLGIPLREIDEVAATDINLDGADEIDSQFRMIKGRGAAMLREKILAAASARRVTMITEDKRVERLGQSAPLPVEVSVFGLTHTERLLQQLGASTTIRRGAGGTLVITDGGNAIVDCRFPTIADPAALDAKIQCLAGVLETGLFIGLCDLLIVGTSQGVEQYGSHG
jgi:ribose 5-phosphate isomerase A